MKTWHEGELVTVARDGAELDGIVSHPESILKIVVAVPDAERGAILRTVHPRALKERAEAGPDDAALHRAIARAPSGRGGPQAGGGGGRGARGHSRGPAHRASGRGG